MKMYTVDESLKSIECQIEYYKKLSLKITDENGLLLAYKIMSSNPNTYDYLNEFEDNDNLITSLRVTQILNALDLIELNNEDVIDGDEISFLKEAVIKYTQLLYYKNSILNFKREYNDERYFEISVLVGHLHDIEELTPINSNKYYIRPVYFEVFYKDEEEKILIKIMAETYSYYCAVLSDEELVKFVENTH